MRTRRSALAGLVGLALAASIAACSSAAAPSATPSPAATASAAASAAASPSAPSATARPSGPASVDGPDEVAAGEPFEVAWTGPAASGDYVTIVKAGATRWTNEPYVDTTTPSPARLVAPVEAGAYELWYVDGATDAIAARAPITVTPFEGDLLGPDSVVAGTTFQVSWNGPNGPGDYVTIVAAGAERWTNESYFYTSTGNPGTLVSPVTAGAYELWYVPGADPKPTARRPITVTAAVITLDAPDAVDAGSEFEVTWTGPNGPSDYITIVPAGSPEGTYLSYAYTAAGSPARITAPDQPGAYEIWYASDRVAGTFARIDITVR